MSQGALFDLPAKPAKFKRPTLDEQFDSWVRANPKIVMLFQQYAIDVKESGARHYGIKAIAERVRWHVVIESQEDDFKINNNYMSRLARLLVKRDPSLAGLFEFRKLISRDSPQMQQIRKRRAAND